MSSGGGKGGSKTQETTIPDWIKQPAIRNMQRAEDVQRIEYMPYYGPDVAAFTPAQNAAFQNNIDTGEAFGLLGAGHGLTPTSGMPTPTDWDGFTGYSSQPIYESALAELKAKQPGAVAQYDALFGANVPTTWGGGGGGSRFRGSASPSSRPSGNNRIELGYNDRKDYVGFDDSYTGAKHGARKPGGGNPNSVPRYIAPGATQAKLDAYAQPYEGNKWEKAAAEKERVNANIAAGAFANQTAYEAAAGLPWKQPVKAPPLDQVISEYNAKKKSNDKMIVDDNVQKLQMSEWEPLAVSNARVAAYNKSIVQEGGQPHHRESVKNVGGSSLFPSHPVSEAGWKLIVEDLRKKRK